MTGYADLHVHQFANRAFGGNVLWGPAGGNLDQSLTSCRGVHGPHGLLDLPGNIGKVLTRMGSMRALLGHRTGGSPDFAGWPRWDDLTHQAVHQAWLKRAVDAGLRLIVMLAVNSRLLCRLSPAGRRTPCDDMNAVDLQLQAAKELEASIDAAAGGPGRGWYRIAYSPEQAQAIVESGRLAVVLGIEVDELFGATIADGSTTDDLAAEVERYHALGVRHIIPIHLYDNRFGAAAFALQIHWSRHGGLISRANPLFSLPVFRMHTVPRTEDGYRYRGGHCNRHALTELGTRLIRLMMEKGMMIDVDHMSAASRADVLQLAEAAGYPVVAGHAEFIEVASPRARSERLLTDNELARIRRLGGIVAPLLRQMSVAAVPASGAVPRTTAAGGTPQAFLLAYRHALRAMPDSAIALGSDLNGFAGLPMPRFRRRGRGALTGHRDPVAYPIVSPVSGATFERSVAGSRTFDINVDGIAHVGMLPDFVAELSAMGLSDDELRPLLRSALGYVDVWRRSLAARP